MQATFLQQWKTILGIVGLALTSLAYIFGWLTEAQAQALGTILGGFTGVMLKLSMNRTENHLANLAAKVVEPPPDPPVGGTEKRK